MGRNSHANPERWTDPAEHHGGSEDFTGEQESWKEKYIKKDLPS